MSKQNSTLTKNLKNNSCQHKEELNKRIISHKSYFYCYKCNNIILIDNDKYYITYKLIDDDKVSNEEVEFDPVITVKNMIQRQEEQIKDINEKLLLNFSYKEEKNNENINSNKKVTPLKDNNDFEDKEMQLLKKLNDDAINNNIFTPPKTKKKKKLTKLLFDDDIFEKYSRIRNRILIYIHNLCTKMEYNDSSFYFSLYLLDTYLSRIISDEITDRELFLVVLGFFLISSKYIEDDIFEPELQIFCNIEKSILLTIEEIRESEVQCLTLINHNMYIYSVYDWITILLSNGIVFEEELSNKEELDNIYSYTQKLLTNLTSKIYFCKYSSIQIAFTIIQLSREKYLNKDLKLSEKIFNLLLNLYEINFSDYEECYNFIKKDMSNETEEESYEESDIDMIINSKKGVKSLEVNLTESNYSNMKGKRNINNIMGNPDKNKYLLSQNSNNYINTDLNLKNDGKKNRIKLYISPGQLNLASHKMKYKSSKSSDKNYEMQSNFNRNLYHKNNKKSNVNRNTLKNMNFKNSTLNLQDPKQILIDYKKIEKHLISNNKKQKNNMSGNSNTLFINYAPKYFIKNTGPNINNINYINNININNEFINLVDKKEKKIQKNTKSGLNFNYVYNINNSKEKSNNKYKLKKSLINRGNSINSLNYEYIIDNIRNLNINNKKKNINTSQNIHTKNDKSGHKKIERNSKEKYKTHLILDMLNNSEGTNRIVLQTEQNQNNMINKHINKNNLNINNNNKIFKINLGHKNDIKILNTKFNLNKQNTRKFAINFKDIINKKITSERTNNFLSKEVDNNFKRFKSLNPKEYINTNINESKSKNIIKNNNNKSKNKNDINNKFNNKNIENKNNLFQKILKENNNLNFKNVASIKSKLPKLKVNKTGLIVK